MNIRERLLKLQDEKYRQFHSALVPNVSNVLGVRVPDIKKIAREFAKTSDWQNYNDDLYYEEIMIQGLLIGYADIELQKRLELLETFIPKITNWGVCDVVCSNLKFTSKNREIVWEFLQKYLRSDKEFEIRFGVVMLISYYLEDEFIEKVIEILDKIDNEEYYAKMAVAWAFSICFVKYWDKTLEYFNKSNINKWVYNKSIQKACESYRISEEQKKLLRKMKK